MKKHWDRNLVMGTWNGIFKNIADMIPKTYEESLERVQETGLSMAGFSKIMVYDFSGDRTKEQPTGNTNKDKVWKINS